MREHRSRKGGKRESGRWRRGDEVGLEQVKAGTLQGWRLGKLMRKGGNTKKNTTNKNPQLFLLGEVGRSCNWVSAVLVLILARLSCTSHLKNHWRTNCIVKLFLCLR